MKTKFIPLLSVIALPVVSPSVSAQFFDEDEFLGVLSVNPFLADSTSNEFGEFGSPYEPDSISNPFGKFDSPYSSFVVRLRGDGKRYLLLTEAAPGDRHYYQAEFQTGTDWQTLEIPFKDMIPHFRGDRLEKPNFPGKTMTQVRIMIGNKKAESFNLEIDEVRLR
jgi:hypothetical protein